MSIFEQNLSLNKETSVHQQQQGSPCPSRPPWAVDVLEERLDDVPDDVPEEVHEELVPDEVPEEVVMDVQ